MQAFLRWWLLVCLLGGSAIGLQKFGWFEHVYNVDQSGLSFIILAGFLAITIKIGMITKQACAGYKPTDMQIDDLYQYCDWMTMLGLIGTVVGMIIILGPAFAGIDISNPATIEKALSIITVGMSTALITTLVGSSCSLLGRLQIVNFHGKT